jgi:hypothetical protein
MTTLKVGIASYEDMKARTMAVARGEHRIAPDEPKGERAKFCVLGWEPVLEEDGELSERLFPFSLWHDG